MAGASKSANIWIILTVWERILLKRSKPSRKKNRLYPDRPVVHGNFDVGMELPDFLPVAAVGAVKQYSMKPYQWKEIATAINKELDVFHKEWIEWACASFIFACIYRDEIPSRDRYLKALRGRVRVLKDLSSALLRELIVPLNKKKQAPLRGIVTTPAEHVRIIATHEWPELLVSLISLDDCLKKLQGMIEVIPVKKRGRDKHYELWHFLQSLIRIAESLGDNLKIPTRDMRDKENRAIEGDKPDKFRTTLTKFVDAIFHALRQDIESIAHLYDLDAGAREKLGKLFVTYLGKKRATLLEDIMSARLFVEGLPRTPKMGKK